MQGQHISSIIIEPESSTALAGGFFGSVSASTDGGRTWERRDSGITKHDVYSLAREKAREWDHQGLRGNGAGAPLPK